MKMKIELAEWVVNNLSREEVLRLVNDTLATDYTNSEFATWFIFLVTDLLIQKDYTNVEVYSTVNIPVSEVYVQYTLASR